MLSLFVGEELLPETVLEKPVLVKPFSDTEEIYRPELLWFDAQKNGIHVQEKALNIRHLPHLSLFAQGAYGDRKSTRLNSSHANISYAVFCLKKKTRTNSITLINPNST